MGKVIVSAVLFFVSAACFAQNGGNIICRLGFVYEISRSANWGMGKPVVGHVVPYSSAELAGIVQGDVIEAIDGIPAASVSEGEIAQLLNLAENNEVLLTVRSLGTQERQARVRKECKRVNVISEDQLASAFNMYSLETTAERQFACPFKVTVTTDSVDFGNFFTYIIPPSNRDDREQAAVVNNYLDKELTRKGLTATANNPDILVQTSFFLNRNPNFKGTNRLLIDKPQIFRYDFSRNGMEAVPFLSPLTVESEAEYILQLRIRLIDQKLVPGRILWECEANELLDGPYRIEDYARIHVPLMCVQYPYVKFTRNIPFTVGKKSYNYTGIQYDIDRMERIASVDRNSPAYAAGVRAGDVIERIGNQRMNHTAEEFSAAYKRFITQTMKYRDPKTLFTDANGFKRCMYWDTSKYAEVSDAVDEAAFISAFSYLYSFTPYMNQSGNNVCVFRIKRGREKMDVTIRPIVRSEITVELK
ncbi:hypothetical protein Barb4_01498 [Bacteroidales bacterium Barb4]|nr:hypothetical protein Barb4_01498 [Bacteroidales bacterium Barb4]